MCTFVIEVKQKQHKERTDKTSSLKILLFKKIYSTKLLYWEDDIKTDLV